MHIGSKEGSITRAFPFPEVVSDQNILVHKIAEKLIEKDYFPLSKLGISVSNFFQRSSSFSTLDKFVKRKSADLPFNGDEVDQPKLDPKKRKTEYIEKSRCPNCWKLIEINEKAIVEHQDYHLALKMSKTFK